MKFIKYAVGLVIALSVIPLVVVTVNNLEAPRLITIEFEVVDVDELDVLYTFSDNTYNTINNYAQFDELGYSTNLVNVSINGINYTDGTLQIYEDETLAYYTDTSYFGGLSDTNISDILEYEPTIGDKWTMTFEVPRSLPPLIKLLVGFAPLLFVGGVLLFMLNKRKLD